MESAKIFIQNRIERDAKLLATIGVFAWQRAIKDVERALPSAGASGAGIAKKMKDSLFLLTSNSSYVAYRPQDNFILPPSKYSAGTERGTFEELNTPIDEIKSVTESIRNILAGKSISDRRGLKSVAPAGSEFRAERQQMAFERKKETVLKREKEGIDAKVIRATGTLTDAAWELKRELEIEGNQAGYRAKRAQKQLQGSLSSIGFLGSVEDKAFRGIGERIFGHSSGDDIMKLGGYSSQEANKVNDNREIMATDLEQERKRILSSLCDCLDNPSESWLGSDHSTEMFKTVIDEYGKNETDLAANLPYYASPAASSPKFTSFNQNLWEELITTMVFTRDNIEVQLNDKEESFQNEDEIIEELMKLENTIKIISSQAAASAGQEASEALSLKLKGGQDATQPSLLISLDDIIDKRKQRIRDEENSLKQGIYKSTEVKTRDIMDTVNLDTTAPPKANALSSPSDCEILDDESCETVVAVSEVIPCDTVTLRVPNNPKGRLSDAEFEFRSTMISDNTATKFEDTEAEAGVYAEVEIVSDDDTIFIQDKTETMNTAALNDSLVSDTPIFVKLFLRSIDITLFVIEKSITVGLPGMLKTFNLMKVRIDESNRQGLGKIGWEALKNLEDASRRY
jgi:hypothetical protein